MTLISRQNGDENRQPTNITYLLDVYQKVYRRWLTLADPQRNQRDDTIAINGMYFTMT